MELRKRIMALTLSVLGCVTILGTSAFAVTPGTSDKVVEQDATLTVRTFETVADGGKAINGVDLSLYKIATIDTDGKYTATSDFAATLKEAGFEDLSVLDLTKSDNNRPVRKALEAFLDNEGMTITPAATAATADGTATFSIGAGDLGLYLVRGGIIENYFDGTEDGKSGKLTYVPDSALVSVPSPPNKELKTDYWDYLPTVNIKYTKGAVWIEPQVLKIIKERNRSINRQRDFTIIFQQTGDAPMPDAEACGWEPVSADQKDGAYVRMDIPFGDSRILTASDTVRQEGSPRKIGLIWYTKPGLYEYLVYEVQETDSNYSFDSAVYRLYVEVGLTDDGTYQGVQWYEKTEGGEVTETSEKTRTGSGSEFTFEFTNYYSRGGDPPEDGDPPGDGNPPGDSTPPDEPGTPLTPEISGALLKTGMLWWPVPILMVAGGFFLAAGFILKKRKD